MRKIDLILRIALLVAVAVNIGLAGWSTHIIREAGRTLAVVEALRAKLEAATAGLDECATPHPGVVPYHDGMTLCPGQRAVGVIPLQAPSEEDQ